MLTQSKNPTLKLSYNIPITVQFETVTAKEIHSEQYDTTSYMYFVIVDGIKHVFFATGRQNEMIQNLGVELGREYVLLRTKDPGDKYEDFKITMVDQSDSKATLDHYFSEQSNSPSKTEHSYVPNKPSVLPEAAAWAIKTAIQSLGSTQSFDSKYANEIFTRALELLRIQQKIL